METHKEMWKRRRNQHPPIFQFDKGKLKNGEVEKKFELGLY